MPDYNSPTLEQPTRQAGKLNLFYGWFIAIAGFAISASVGITGASFGIFVKPLEQEFGWSRSLIASASTFFLVGVAISSFVSGRLADRYRPRIILLPAAILTSFGLVMCGQMSSPVQFLLFTFIIGLGAGATITVPVAAVQRWFRNRRGAGMALGIVFSGSATGTMIFPNTTNQFILNYGWRGCYIINGVLFFVILFLFTFILKPNPATTQTVNGASQTKLSEGMTARKALTTFAFASIVFCASASGFAYHFLGTHLVPYITDLGISSTMAAAIYGLIGGMSIAGHLSCGFMGGRTSWHKILAISAAFIVLAILWLLFARSVWAFYVFTLSFGFLFGIRTVSQYAVLSEFFGLHSIGTLVGVTGGIANLVSALGPFVGGLVFDNTGSYSIAFLIILGLLAISTLAIVFMKNPMASR